MGFLSFILIVFLHFFFFCLFVLKKKKKKKFLDYSRMGSRSRSRSRSGPRGYADQGPRDSDYNNNMRSQSPGRGNQGGRGRDRSPESNSTGPMKTVYVANMNFKTREEDVEKFCGEVGKVNKRKKKKTF